MAYKKNYKRKKNTKNKTRYSGSKKRTYSSLGGADEHNAAFYAGVGYGKGLSGEEVLGFNSDNDRKSFERGALRHDKYFNSYGKEEKPQGFFARLIYLFRG